MFCVRKEKNLPDTRTVANTHKFLGDHGEGETPVPIPNTAVKPFSADGTAWATVWESRTLPRLKFTFAKAEGRKACQRWQAFFCRSNVVTVSCSYRTNWSVGLLTPDDICISPIRYALCFLLFLVVPDTGHACVPHPRLGQGPVGRVTATLFEIELFRYALCFLELT